MVVLIGVTVGACSSAKPQASTASGGSSNGVAPGAPDLSTKEAAGGAKANGAPAAPGADGQPASFNTNALDQQGPEAGRAVISTATMTVKVDNVAPSKERAAAVAESAGGFLFAEQTTFGEKSRAVLTLKVPPAEFRKVLVALGELGALEAEEVKSDDVTQQVVDLDARILATEASLGRTRDLLGQAKSLVEISQLETEVVRRQSDLESLKGQRQTLQAKVDMATIVITLNGEKDSTPAIEQQRREEEQRRADEERKRNEAKPLPGFFDGLDGGLSVAKNVGTVTLAVIGALLPFLPLLVIAVVIVRVMRRGARRRAGGTGPASDPGPPAAAPAR